jgi:hypothetical protein
MEGDRIGKVSLVLDIATCKGTSIACATGLQISVCQIFALHSIEKGSRSYHCTNEAPPFHQEKLVFLLHRKYSNNIQAFLTKDAGIQNLMEAWTCGHWWQCSERLRLFNHFGLILSKLQSCLALEKMLELAELRLHLRDEYMRRGNAKDRLRPLRHIIPDALSPQNKDTTTSASSDEIHLEITPETNRFDLYGDENLLTSIAEALGQRSVLDDVEDPAAGPPHSLALQTLVNFDVERISHTAQAPLVLSLSSSDLSLSQCVLLLSSCTLHRCSLLTG